MGKSVADQIAELEKGIAALEAQRAVLGGPAVDAAVSGMRQKLDGLRATTPERQRKLATVLFADVSGFTRMSEAMDAEDVTDMMNSVWQRLDAAILQRGGAIDKHIGDAVVALWGVETANEDDPERAIAAALDMQAALKDFVSAQASPRGLDGGVIQMRIGVNTGPVLLGEVGTAGEFTALGDTVTIANRLEQAAQVGSVLISRDTYRHVRGVFDVVEQEPITAPGRAEPLQVYEAQRAKPRAFRIGMRGVEGVETRMVGRDTELDTLKAAFESAIRMQEVRAITITGEAGVGKSRLLHEFRKWLELLPDQVWFFSGRGNQQLASAPFGLIREVISNRLQIQDNDTAAAAREKLVKGVERVLGPDTEPKAHAIGKLIGIDFPDSPYFKGQGEEAGPARNQGFQRIAELLQGFNRRDLSPLAIVLEDFHWADAGSLDVVESLARLCDDTPILILCLARPLLYERFPGWGKGWYFHSTMHLAPLNKDDSRHLVDDILQKVENIPDVLRELVVTRAEGNPYYLEELIKMLIEDGVIVKSADRWLVQPDKLVTLRVPPTLTGVLQARLDSLPPEEKGLLQRAAVVGRIFWDRALAELTDNDRASASLDKSLERLIDRELIFQREASVFAGAHEYTFKHTILHEVAYDSLLKKQRRVYHLQVARWLVTQSGERAAEYVGLIADHYERAGEIGKALEYLNQAGVQALRVSAYQDAVTFFERGLALATGPSAAELLNARQWEGALKQQIGRACQSTGELARSRETLEDSLAVAREIKDRGTMARALTWLGSAETLLGDYESADAHQRESIEIAREQDDITALATALMSLGDLCYRRGSYDDAIRYLDEGLALSRELGDRWRQGTGLQALGFVHWGTGDYHKATEYFSESLELQQAIGDRNGMADALNGLGAAAYMLKDYPGARAYYEAGLEHARAIGPLSPAISRALINLGEVAFDMGDFEDAESFQTEALLLSTQMGAAPKMVYLLFGMARLKDRAGDKVTALEWVTLARNHPATASDILETSEQYYADLQKELPPNQAKAAIKRGKALKLEEVVDRILAASPA